MKTSSYLFGKTRFLLFSHLSFPLLYLSQKWAALIQRGLCYSAPKLLSQHWEPILFQYGGYNKLSIIRLLMVAIYNELEVGSFLDNIKGFTPSKEKSMSFWGSPVSFIASPAIAFSRNVFLQFLLSVLYELTYVNGRPFLLSHALAFSFVRDHSKTSHGALPVRKPVQFVANL